MRAFTVEIDQVGKVELNENFNYNTTDVSNSLIFRLFNCLLQRSLQMSVIKSCHVYKRKRAYGANTFIYTWSKKWLNRFVALQQSFALFHAKFRVYLFAFLF